MLQTDGSGKPTADGVQRVGSGFGLEESLVSGAGIGREASAGKRRIGRSRRSKRPRKLRLVRYLRMQMGGGSRAVAGFSGGDANQPDIREQAFDGYEVSGISGILQLELNDTYYILFYGAGALLALWISSSVVTSIDSLPLFPKVMELVGLGYTIWFSYRYLFFKKNRQELFSMIEDLKEQIIGQSDYE